MTNTDEHCPTASPAQAETKRSARIWVPRALKLIVSAGLLFVLLRNANLGDIWQSMRTANPWVLAVAFSLHGVGFLLSAFRWRLLLRTRDSDASVVFLVRSYVVGVFFNNFLPSTIGGDVYRAYDSWKLGQSKSSAVAVVFVDRFLGLFALMLFALVALSDRSALTQDFPALLGWVILGTVGMTAFLWLIFAPPRWLPALIARVRLPAGGKIKRVVEAFLAFEGERRALAQALVLSLLLQANVVLHYYLISESLGLEVPLSSFFLIIPLAIVIMMVPVSVNGIGVREGVFVLFFAPFGVAAAEAIAFSWLAYGMTVVQGVLGGVLYATRK